MPDTPTIDHLADELIKGAFDLEAAADLLQPSHPTSAAMLRGQAGKMRELELRIRPFAVAPDVWSRAPSAHMKPRLRII